MNEDDFPTSEHRPMFDTEPCPPEIVAGPFHLTGTCEEVAEQVRKLDDFYGVENGNPVRVSANGRSAFPVEPVGEYCGKCGARQERHVKIGPGHYRAVAPIAFPGGAVPVPEPTREALLLSARQWATAVRECWQDNYRERDYFSDKAMVSKLDRLDAVLAELAAL